MLFLIFYLIERSELLTVYPSDLLVTFMSILRASLFYSGFVCQCGSLRGEYSVILYG